MSLPRPTHSPLPHQRPAEGRSSLRPQVEDTAAELIHSVMAQDWSDEAAGQRVLDRARGDRHLLLVLRARIARRLIGRPSPIGERAVAALNVALDTVPEDTADKEVA